MSDDIKPIARKRGRPKGSGKAAGGGDDSGGVRALDRAFDILDLLAAEQGLTLSDIATRMSLAPSTVHRLLSTLAARGVLESDPLTQTWYVGATSFRHGSAFMRRSGLIDRSWPVLRRLMEITGETANLGIMNGDAVLFIGQVETHETIRAFFPPGTRSPLHCSGIGKALLAHAPETVLRTFLRGSPLGRYTQRTITESAALIADLTEVRDRGYSIDDEERAIGMRCIAAPIFDMFGEAVAGISVSGPSHRMTEARLPTFGAEVARGAAELSMGQPASADIQARKGYT